MGFHNVLFPEGVQYGTQGGPAWRTQVTELDSGGEERVSRWPRSRRVYDAVHNIKSLDDLGEILSFFEARNGAANAFRFKDWNDYTTSATNRGTPAKDDVLIATGDGTTKSFQLFKEYQTAGSESKFQRTIKLPKTPAWGGTIHVCLNGGSELTWGTDFTVSDVGGVLELTTAPGVGVELTAGWEFHVPVRFSEGSDETMRVAIDAYESGSLPEVPLIEILDDILAPDDYLHGWGAEFNYDAPFWINPSDGKAIRWHGTLATTAKFLNASSLPSGGPWHTVWNDGDATLTLNTLAQGNFASLAADEQGVLYIFKVDGVNTWKLFK